MLSRPWSSVGKLSGSLGSEFCRNLRRDYEPTARGVAIDNAVGVFLLRWPIDNPA